MYAREIYGLMMAGAMLLIAGCSADDVVKETTSQEAIAISFSCNYDNQEEHPTRAGHKGLMNIEDLYTTGFGVMASTSDTKVPNLMYNQKVEFTLVGDLEQPDPEDPESRPKGYWSYSPLKYWPTSTTDFYISAYAPYLELPIDGSGTGIIGISGNSAVPYVDYRRCDKPNQLVDLLWYYVEPASIPAATEQQPRGTLAMKMRHALARLEIKVAVGADPGTTKVLIEKITLKGKMAKTGRLSLSSQETAGSGVDTKYYPVWSNQVFDKNGGGNDIDHTIEITNEDNDPDSYGIIESQVRYIPGLPYSWQPAGLSITPQDALNTGDRKGYIYLIPQDELELTVKVKYKKWVSGEAAPTPGEKTTTASTLRIPTPTLEDDNPKLRGNTTYTLNLTLSGI